MRKKGFGLRMRYMNQSAVVGLTRWMLNPGLEYLDGQILMGQ
jgi:hypothetical protein